MKEYSSGNPIVDQMAKIQITGNVTPPAWYKTITLENGKPNSVAITILSDIVYWYRPTELRDEASGEYLGIRKKFREDYLQRSYQQISEQFGYTKRQAKDAIVALEKLGVVKRIFRTVSKGGVLANNVMYLELVPERLLEITYPEEMGGLCRYNDTGMAMKSDSLPRSMATGASVKRQTNTENTAKNTYQDYPIVSADAVRAECDRFRRQIGYDAILLDLPFKKGQLDEIVSVAADVLSSKRYSIRVNREERPAAQVKERFRELDINHVKYVLESMANSTSEVKNMRAVIITSLYNAPATVDNYYAAKVNHELAK